MEREKPRLPSDIECIEHECLRSTAKRTRAQRGLEVLLRIVSITLRIVSIKILELVNIREGKGDKRAVTPFDSRNRAIRTKKGLSVPDPPPTDHSSFPPAKATQLIVDKYVCRGKN